MVRISDILKKKMQATTPAAETKPAVPSEAHPALPQEEPAREPIPRLHEMHIAKAMRETEPDIERSRAVYSKGIQLTKEILNNAREEKPIDLAKIKDLVAEIVDSLVSSDRELSNLFYEHSQENYLYNHMVNVLIMSVEVGLGLGYNKSKLHELGLAAFLHDIGMVKVENLALEPRALTDEEHNQIKEHPVYGAEILSKINGIPEAVICAAGEEHERMNGKGYPRMISDGEISEYGRIIGAVDVYEALTHERAHRKKYLPNEAVKEIITAESSLFDPAVLRVLISQVGIYPIGSWLELNSNEICKVINTNDELPLRPVVSIIFDGAGNRLEDPRVVNLAAQSNFFVKRPLADEEVSQKVKEEVR